METLDRLEIELTGMLQNVANVRGFVEEQASKTYGASQSLLVGELKHRAIILKNVLTRVQSLNTSTLINEKRRQNNNK